MDDARWKTMAMNNTSNPDETANVRPMIMEWKMIPNSKIATAITFAVADSEYTEDSSRSAGVFSTTKS